MVEPGKHPCLKSHIREESWVCAGVSKRINVPADAWHNSEFFLEELVTLHHVVDHVLVVWACLIVHAPSCIHKLESAFFDEALELVFGVLALLVVPHREEFHFYI